MEAAETVMEQAAAAATEQPKTIKTDRLASYPYAISLVFPHTEHVQSDGIRAIVNNNLSDAYREHSGNAPRPCGDWRTLKAGNTVTIFG